jgi:hypothetical protein
MILKERKDVKLIRLFKINHLAAISEFSCRRPGEFVLAVGMRRLLIVLPVLGEPERRVPLLPGAKV